MSYRPNGHGVAGARPYRGDFSRERQAAASYDLDRAIARAKADVQRKARNDLWYTRALALGLNLNAVDQLHLTDFRSVFSAKLDARAADYGFRKADGAHDIAATVDGEVYWSYIFRTAEGKVYELLQAKGFTARDPVSRRVYAAIEEARGIK